jgi:acetyltransferase-like isoleucine patch superfamily enzyme
VIILPGTIVEDNCIIAAGSVVNKLIESNSVYAGVPAKKIKDLK